MNADSSKVMKFLGDLVVYTKYSNYMPQLKRRQTWDESINVLENMYIEKFPNLSSKIIESFKFVREKKVLASMRSIQFGGLPIEINPARVFNCSYGIIDHPFFFAESMFLLLCGTGVGFSSRKHHVKKLPKVGKPDGDRRFLVGDSIEGWADSIRQLVYAYMRNNPKPRFDYSDIRKKGTLIKKTGGTAPGPEKLKYAHQKIEAVLIQAIGRRLTELEASDIMCYLADCVLSGGVREAAMINLFDIDNTDLLTCKSVFNIDDVSVVDTKEDGWKIKFTLPENQIMNINCYNDNEYQEAFITNKFGDYDLKNAIDNKKLPFYYLHPQRGRMNISVAAVRNKTTREQFDKMWDACKKSGAGEPGIYWCNDTNEGTNPCAEIGLKPFQFCNLTSINVYNVESQQDLNKRARVAAFIGTLQASYTDFHYLRPIWKETTEDDALLGVSMTGIASGRVLQYNLEEAALCVNDENKITSKEIGINIAANTTCLKPEGTGTFAAGVLGNGIHSIHDHYFFRNNRIKKKEPVYQFLKELMPEFVNDEFLNEEHGAVVSMPIKAPDGCLLRNEGALAMLERVRKFTSEWVRAGHNRGNHRHNVSATVSISNEEWGVAADWMWENREIYNGLACLPYSDHVYKQAPFETITKEQYERALLKFPKNVDFTSILEETNNVELVQQLACAGGAC